jgi:hypothetical protein
LASAPKCEKYFSASLSFAISRCTLARSCTARGALPQTQRSFGKRAIASIVDRKTILLEALGAARRANREHCGAWERDDRDGAHRIRDFARTTFTHCILARRASRNGTTDRRASRARNLLRHLNLCAPSNCIAIPERRRRAEDLTPPMWPVQSYRTCRSAHERHSSREAINRTALAPLCERGAARRHVLLGAHASCKQRANALGSFAVAFIRQGCRRIVRIVRERSEKRSLVRHKPVTKRSLLAKFEKTVTIPSRVQALGAALERSSL